MGGRRARTGAREREGQRRGVAGLPDVAARGKDATEGDGPVPI